MTDLQVFNYEGAEVRTVDREGETWWVLKDVCGVLELSDTNKVTERIDSDDLTRIKIVSGGQTREMYAVNESGLYNVILRSDKAEAKKFKRWVTHEVLPSIRKHGAYMTAGKVDEMLNDPESWIKLLGALKAEREEKEVLSSRVEADRPKVLFADAVAVSEGAILIGELAKILKANGVDVGQNRLFEKLRGSGFLIRRRGTDFNMPTQRSMELGLFKIKETAVTHSDGHVTVSKTPKVTGKGQAYFVNYFIGKENFYDG
jgi:anti-repressor protein